MKFSYSGLIIFLLIVSISLILRNYNLNRQKSFIQKSEIIGTIQNIKYNKWMVPLTISVNGEEFNLYVLEVDKEDDWKVGDSVFKNKNDHFLKYYKKYYNGFYLHEIYEIID